VDGACWLTGVVMREHKAYEFLKTKHCCFVHPASGIRVHALRIVACSDPESVSPCFSVCPKTHFRTGFAVPYPVSPLRCRFGGGIVLSVSGRILPLKDVPVMNESISGVSIWKDEPFLWLTDRCMHPLNL
jgi:hypothetical protein